MRDTPGKLGPNAPLVTVMAVACGVAVANIYYAQPLLHLLAQDFRVSTAQAGLIVTMTQLGYASGLVFVVPLGDLLERRRLVSVVSLGTVAALVATALAPDIAVFVAASLVVGLTAVVAQVLVPFAAHLAKDELRGRVVGRVMTGLLLGVLLARTLSGVVAHALGWRAVFGLAAGLMLGQTILLARVLPKSPGNAALSYPALLRSVLALLRDEPLIRRRSAYGAAAFAAFSTLWTTLPFLLSALPYRYDSSAIGAFGLLGAAGALAASFAGHLHDRGHSRAATGAALGLVVGSFVLMGALGTHVSAIVAGILVRDFGVQGAQILNQSAIYALRPEARSRITTAYMTCYFFGGALGSASSAWVFAHAGWAGSCALGGGFVALALLFWLTEPRKV